MGGCLRHQLGPVVWPTSSLLTPASLGDQDRPGPRPTDPLHDLRGLFTDSLQSCLTPTLPLTPNPEYSMEQGAHMGTPCLFFHIP